MKILGIDFTSAPSRIKPITCAVGELTANQLHITTVDRLPTFAAFEQTLAQSGPYVAGFDFPFSQPRRLIENLGWPTDWAALIDLISMMGKESFESKFGVILIRVLQGINCIAAKPMFAPTPSAR